MHFKSEVAAATAAIIMTSVAAADFTHISGEFTGTASAPGDTGFWAIRIFANFNNPGDRLLSVIDANYTSIGDQQLYQNPFSTGVEPLAALIPVFPDLKWTSYVTIGHRAMVTGQPATSFDPDGE